MARAQQRGAASPAPTIEGYALVGDTRTAALVSRAGSIDWMCVPRFDAPPLFGRLVDRDAGGSFSIDVAGTTSATRRYLDGSAVLETAITSSTGRARVTDAMVGDVTGRLLPHNVLVRKLVCDAGDVTVDVTFDPRHGLPGKSPQRHGRVRGALVCEWGSLAVSLSSTGVDVVPGRAARVALSAGDAITFVVSVADRSPLILVPPDDGERLTSSTAAWWRSWSEGLRYDGPHRDAVVRSLITLRLLTYSPSGAPVAAPTTSLPEAIGATRNWDYRYAWPRDASIGVAAFLAAGDRELAHAFMHWLLHASRLTRPRLSVMYDVYGRPAPDEQHVDASGYMDSTPVRVGNAATAQHQLDVYGWVIDAGSLLESSGGRVHGETWRALAGFGDVVAAQWTRPDAGIWEVRGRPAHYVHSKLMAWLALDRLLRMAARRRVRRTRVRAWTRERDRIAAWVRTRGVDESRGALVWKEGGADLDASLLLLPVLEFEPPGSPLTIATIDAIRRELEIAPGLVLRYRRLADDLDGDEGAFLPCSFWLVQALARAGRLDEAHETFGTLLSYANDVGLWGEEMDPSTKAHLGNFPQAFTHATLVQAALALQRADAAAREAA
ncbi:MAG TPA: glycoside hydrolase family 15 protein [Actinomycetota bacterium]|nr:glycoside hydrolase family 15 protein [Actinomycetota bacterium]